MKQYQYWMFFTIMVICATACQNAIQEQESEMTTATATVLYQEPYRPQFHFSPPSGWMNDPNGMFYYDGVYHLFYQYYPYASVWGPMHWGHATSRDMVNWNNEPIALYPDDLGMIFSGSAVVDKNNTSGFQSNTNAPIVAMYTYHQMTKEKQGDIDFQTQAIAYSNDLGKTWTKYADNPVIKNPGVRDFRDPKVFWHEKSQQWVMILSRANRVQIYNSPNLKEWTLGSEFGEQEGAHGGVWECPDLFELPVDNNPADTKWLMIVSLGSGGPNGGSGTQYFIGDFDGTTFQNDNPPNRLLWMDYGKDNYAGVTFSDIPVADGRRIFMGWMSNWQYATKVPTTTWRSAMTLPRVLTLKNTKDGVRLITTPVKELEKLRTSNSTIAATTINKELSVTTQELAELKITFDLVDSDAKSFGLELYNDLGEYLLLRYDRSSDLYILDRSNAGDTAFSPDFSGLHFAPRSNVDQPDLMDWHIFIDKSAIEIFTDGGATVLTAISFPTAPFDRMRLFTVDGSVALRAGKVFDLKSIWTKQ